MKHLKYKRFDGYCGIATLANVFQDENILEYMNDKSYIPCSRIQMNKILKIEGYDVKMSAVIELFSNMKIPNTFVKYCIMDESMIVPKNGHYIFILNVQTGNTLLTHHAVAILKFEDKILYSDPNNSDFIELNDFDEIFNMFKYCSAIWTMTDKNDKDIHLCYLPN